MLTSLGSLAARHPWRTLAAWMIAVVISVAASPLLLDSLTTDMGDGSGSESARADDRIDELGRSVPGDAARPDDAAYAVLDGLAVDDPSVQDALAGAVAEVRSLPGVAEAIGPADDPALRARDGQAAAVVVELASGDDGEQERTVDAVEHALRDVGAERVLVGTEGLVDREIEDQAEQDLLRGEAIALPIAFVALVVVFSGVLAAVLPITLALASITGALIVLLFASAAGDVAAYAINVVTMFGIGLGIDYGLLLVSRFREERRQGHAIDASIARSVATAGRTIVFSGLTVAVSLAGLLLFDSPGLRSLATGGIGVVLVAVVAAVTLLPALLTLVGHRIRPGQQAREHGPFWRLAGWVRRRALVVVAVVGGLLAFAALPFLGARFENPDARSLPRSSTARQLEELRPRFPELETTAPIEVLAETSPDDPRLAEWLDDVGHLDGVAAVHVDDRLAAAGATLIEIVPDGPDEGTEAQGLVRAVRDHDAPFPVLVTGDAAELVDLKASIASRLPWALAVVALATVALLFLMTGSVVVPLKAVLMNLLSLGATFGVLVLVFQEGHLSGLLGFDPVGALDATIPLVVFLFAFGLSMDYEVFLLARIKEAWDETHDNDLAIATGLDRTGRIITSAAALLVIVFAGFAAGELVLVKQLGVGLAVAVIVDATLVRCLLVPATMTLMGRWNWWAPRGLRRVHARFGLAEAGPHDGEQADHDPDRPEHEQDLVPATLVGQHLVSPPRGRG
jgi:RND superfamily putative drug exporter